MKRTFSPLITAIAAGAIAVPAAGAVTITSRSTGPVHLCAATTTGALRAAAHCERSERALSVDRRGPAGPVGPAGMSGYHIVTNTYTVVTASTWSVDATCPAGQHVLGGGGTPAVTDGSTGDPNAARLIMSFPIGENTWRVAFAAPAGILIQAYAICASVTS